MRIIVLFNLKPEADPAAYEAWARGTDQRNADEIESTRASADRIITVRRAPTGDDQPD